MSPEARGAGPGEAPGRADGRAALPLWVMAGVFLLGVLVWFRLEHAARDAAASRFAQQADDVLSRIDGAFAALESEVRSVSGLMVLEPRLSRADWQTFVRASRPSEPAELFSSAFYRRVPCAGLDAYERTVARGQPGYRVWPRGSHSECFPLEFSSRDARGHALSSGFDAGSDPARRDAMRRAVAARGVGYTGVVHLSRVDQGTQTRGHDPEPAVIAFAPVFAPGRTPVAGGLDTPDLVGFAGAGVRLLSLLSDATAGGAELAVALRVGHDPGRTVTLGEAQPPVGVAGLLDSDGRFVRERTLARGDAAFHVRLAPTAGFWARQGGAGHGIVLLAAALAALTVFMLLRRGARLQHESRLRHAAALEHSEARHQRMLAESQRRHRMAFASSGMGLWEWDPGSDRLYLSNEAAAMLELGAGDPFVSPDGLGEGWFVDAEGIAAFAARVHPDDREARDAAMAAILREHRPMQLSYRVRARDGAYRVYRSYGNAACDDRGRATQCFGTLQDITETRTLEERVERGRRLLDGMLNALPYPVFAKDAAGRFVAANDLACRLLGRPREAVIGRTDADFFPPDRAAQFAEEDRRALAGDAELVADAQVEHADGSVRWMHMTKSALRGKGLDPIVVVAMVDITERIEAFHDARRARDFLDAVLQSIPVAVSVKDQNNRFVLASQEMLRFFDLPADGFIGKTDADVFGEASAERNLAQDATLLQAPDGIAVEEQYTLASGRTRWVFKKKRAFGLSDGSRYVAVSLVDIEERKRAELSALRDRAFLEAIVNAIPSFVVVKDRDLRWVVANEAIARWAGRSPETARGIVDADVLSREVSERTDREDREVLASGRTLRGEVVSVSVAGERRWFEKSKSLLRMPDGDVYVIGVSTDIHDRKLAELRSQAARRRLELLRLISENTVAGRPFADILRFAVEALAPLLPGTGIAFVDGSRDAATATALRAGVPSLAELAAVAAARPGESGGVPAAAVVEVRDGDAAEGAGIPRMVGHVAQGGGLRGTVVVAGSAGHAWSEDEQAVLRDVTAALSAALDHAAARDEREKAEAAARAGKAFLDALLDALPQSVFVRDAQGRLVLGNARFFDTIKRDRAAVLGRTNVETYGPVVGAVLDAQDQRAWSSPDIEHFEQRTLDPAIPHEWQLKTKSAVSMPDGSRYLVCTASDITRRKRAELAAAKGRAFLETLLNTFPQPVYVKDRAHRLILVNDAGCAQFGRPREALLGLTDRDLLAPEYAERAWREEAQLWETGQGYSAEAELAVAGREPRWILKTKSLITMADGSRAMIATSVDITSRKAAEREVMLHRQRLEMLDALATLMLAGVPLAELQAAAVARLSVLLAPAAASLWRLDDDGLFSVVCGARAGEAVAADGARCALAGRAWYREALERMVPVEVTDVAADSRLAGGPEAAVPPAMAAWLDVPIRMPGGRTGLLRLASERPVTWTAHDRESARRLAEYLNVAHLNAHAEGERAAAEAALRRHRDELEAQVAVRTRELEIARDAAIAANEAKSDFLANMSHELRTPMHAILSFSRLGLDRLAAGGAPTEKVNQYLERIHQSGSRLLRLLNDLLDLSKLEARRMTYEFGRADLREIAALTVTELSAVARERGVGVRFDATGPAVAAWCDASRIGQVAANVLGNAIKFSPAGSVVQVEVAAAGPATDGMARLTVTDEGAGIPEHEREAVFDKFVQSSKTKSGAGGTGLGLAICREIVTQHGGRIWAESGARGGARFVVLLPEAPPDGAALRSVA